MIFNLNSSPNFEKFEYLITYKSIFYLKFVELGKATFWLKQFKSFWIIELIQKNYCASWASPPGQIPLLSARRALSRHGQRCRGAAGHLRPLLVPKVAALLEPHPGSLDYKTSSPPSAQNLLCFAVRPARADFPPLRAPCTVPTWAALLRRRWSPKTTVGARRCRLPRAPPQLPLTIRPWAPLRPNFFPRRSSIGAAALPLHGDANKLPPPLPFLQIWLRLPMSDLIPWPSCACSAPPDHRRAPAPPLSLPPKALPTSAPSGEPHAYVYHKMGLPSHPLRRLSVSSAPRRR
jgi:hypothetical protein